MKDDSVVYRIVRTAEDCYLSGTWGKKISIPESATNISVIYISGVEFEIPSEEFSNCPNVKEIEICDNGNCYAIGNWAFSGSGISEVIIPDGVKQIWGGAFSNCPNLKKVRLPNTLTYIGEGAFSNCPQLEEVNLTESSKIKYCGEGIFKNSKFEGQISPSLNSISLWDLLE